MSLDESVAGGFDDELEEGELLHFGDFISFFDNDHRGFAFGHLSGSLAVMPNADTKDPRLGNFKSAVFQIHAHNKYKANKKLRTMFDKMKAKNITMDEALLEGDNDFKAAKEMADAETSDNTLEQKRRNGDIVFYGQLVQLWHTHSQQYVKVSSSTTSKREASNMRVELEDANSRNAWFRIMPRYKVRAEGDHVRMGDQVVLESVKTSGQFLHSSELPIPNDNLDEGCHEINLSVDQTSFMIMPFYHPEPLHSRLLKAGDVIQLFHKEISAYLSAEGVFSEDSPREDVHLRIREPDPRRPHRLDPPTSCNTFFQVEIEGEPTRGKVVEWETQVRFKHVGTQMYLTLVRNAEGVLTASLTRNIRDPNGVFLFYAVIRESNFIKLGSYTRIRHAITSTWLHAAQDRPYARRWELHLSDPSLRNALHEKMSEITWDQAALINCGATEERMFDDAFIIYGVAPENVNYVAFVTGMIPVMEQYCRLRLRNEITPLETHFVVVALNELKEFMYTDGVSDRMRQKLVRNLGMVELLARMMQAPFKPYNTSDSAITLKDIQHPRNKLSLQVVRAAYSVLQSYLDGDSRKNELYVAKHIPFFQTQVGGDVGVEKMYIDLVRDNAKIVFAMGDPEIMKFIDLLKTDKNPDYLDFLLVLCSVDGAGISFNQDKISQLILRDNKNMVYTTELDRKRGEVMVNTTGRPQDWQPLRSFCKSGLREEDASKEYLFLQKQLDLFGDLCMGRNENCIELITRELNYLNWEECFHCARDDQLPKALRSMYIELMIYLFIDVGENVDILEEVKLSVLWDKLNGNPYKAAAQDPTMSLSGARMPFFPELNAWILTFLTNSSVVVASDKNTNKLLISVLKLVHTLVTFGYYVGENVSRLMTPLTAIVDGTTDIPHKGERRVTISQPGNRRKTLSSAAVNTPVVLSNEEYIKQWRRQGRYEKSAVNNIVVDVKFVALEILDSLFNYTLSLRLQHFLYDFKQVFEWTGDRRMTRASKSGHREEQLPLDLEGPTLTADQMETLRNFANHTVSEDHVIQFTGIVREYCMQLFDRSNYIAPGFRSAVSSKRQHHGKSPEFIEVLLDLARYDFPMLCTKSLFLLNRFFSANQDLFELAGRAQILIVPDSIEFADYLNRQMPMLRRLGGGQIEREEMDEFNEALGEIAKKCCLSADLPHRTNQEIAYNAGLITVLFDVLDQEDQESEVIAATFGCLRAMVSDFPLVQQQMFDRLSLLLTINTKNTGWENDMSLAINELFRNNQKACLALKPQELERMMLILAEHTTTVPGMLLTLRSVSRVDALNVPLKRNQELIIKYLMQFREKIIDVAYIEDTDDPKINKLRMDLLQYKGRDQEQLRLQRFHVALVSLFASCAEGDNRYIESICQTIFSIDELLEVILDDDISTFCKTAYIRYFVWVYIDVFDENPLEIGTQHLHTDQRLWQAIRRLAQTEFPRLYKDRETLTPEQVDFVYGAYLPLLTRVAKKHYNPGEFPESTSVLKDVGAVISDFVRRCIQHMYDHNQIKELSAVASAVNSVGSSFIGKDALLQLRDKLTSNEAGAVMNPALANYIKKYSKQIELHGKFNRFVANIKSAYNGRNQVRVQLPHASNDRIINDKQYCEDETEDEHLPLGPEFQHFVDVFAQYTHAGSGRRADLRVEDVKSLVRQLMSSRVYWATLDAKGKMEQERLDIRILQILRTLIHNQEKLEVDPTVVRESIAHAGAVLPVADMLSVTNNDVVREALALLVAILGSGNKAAQDAFIEHFFGTREETFFDDVQSRIRKSIEGVRELRSLRRQVVEERANQNALMGTMSIANSLTLGAIGSSDTDGAPSLQSRSKVDDALEIKDEGNIELVLRVLQYMCEGHNTVLQNYLREQPDNIRSMDLVSATVEFLQVLIEDINGENVELVIQTVEALVEFCQGCVSNQKAVFDAQAIDHLNHILRLPEFKECDDEKEAHLKLACANLILSMLEENDPDTKQMAREIEETLDIPAVFRNLHFYHEINVSGEDKLWTTDEDTDEEPVVALDVAFSFFNILVRLEDFTGVNYSTIPRWNPTFCAKEGERDKVYDTIAGKTVSIEIMRHDTLQKIHFLDKWKDEIRRDVKEELLWGVDRSSPSDKIRDYLERAATIMADIDYYRDVMDASPLTQLLVKKSAWWSNMLLLFTFALNIIILSTWRANLDDAKDSSPHFAVSWYSDVLAALGGCHIFFSALVTLTYFLLKPPSLTALLESMPLGGAILDAFPSLKDESDRTKTSPLSLSSLHHILVLLFSVLGVFYDGYFYCYHLLHIVVGNDILLRVIQSVTKNGMSLLWVAALIIIIIYIYTLVSFAFLRESYSPDDNGAFCENMFQCFVSSIRLGLISGGGLGENLAANVTKGFEEPGLRVIYDVSYFIIVTVIGLNVVFGIIVDTFSELRDEKYEIQESMVGECFICSLKNYEFERFGNGFDYHVKHEHCMWHYLSFLIHLNKKDPNEYTSHEQFVVDQLAANETSFFPINRALCLQNSEDKGVEERVERVERLLTGLVERYDRETEERRATELRQQRRAWARQATKDSI